ncbi:MAG: SRPBCC domain-containing protein [Thermoleophilia bacterium]
MPRSYEVTRAIAASPEHVWALLTDDAGYATWNPAVISIKGPIAPGGRLSLVSSASPGRTFTPTVTAMEAPSRMVWSDAMPLGLFRGARTFTLAPAAGGTTDFHMREAFTGPLAPLISRAIPDLTESIERFADGLKAAAEASR